MEKISVLLPVYDLEKPDYFRLCLESIYEQSHAADEVIIVKDGEINNKLLALIDEFKKKINIVDILYTGDKKLSGALSYGLKFCKNEIIARADSDDIYHRDRLKEQIAYFQKEKNLSVLGTWVMEFNEEVEDLKIIRRGFPAKNLFFINNPVHHSSVMFRKKDIIHSGSYISLEGFEDWYLWLRVHENGFKIKNLQKILAYVRVGDNFFDRRSGFGYIKQEIFAHKLFYRKNLITFLNIFFNLIIRIPLRLLPKSILKFIYSLTRK